MRAYQFISEKAVSKKQQQFFGIVRAMQKGDMPKSGEAGEVAKDMKKSDVKDFAKTKHKGLPTKKTSEEAAGVGIVTKQNATADVPVGGEYMNVKKLFPKKKKKKESLAYVDMFQGLNPKSQIYVDMDGVLADFFGEWKKLVGKDWRQLGKDEIEPALKKIRDEDKFWLNIPLTSNAKKLLGIIKQVKGSYKILSSPLANDPNSEPHKREWIKKNLDFFPPTEVIITKDKAKYATNPDGTPNILIDDYGVNIAAWESAGGIGFKHKDHKFERTAKKLKAEIDEDFQNLMREFIEGPAVWWAKQLQEAWSAKYKKSINCSNPKGFSQKAHCAGRKKNEGAEITMWTNPKYQGADVDDKYYKKQPAEVLDVSKLTPFEPADKMDPKDNHDNMMKFVDKIKEGEKVKPIVVVPHEGKLLIVDGHHRYFAHLKAGVDKIRAVIADPKDLTWRDDVPESLKENFADGKKKGKSRPGRVKKSGASCKGSVTSLRAKAKKYGGEKGRMYHWCANMKGGKKKAK